MLYHIPSIQHYTDTHTTSLCLSNTAHPKPPLPKLPNPKRRSPKPQNIQALQIIIINKMKK